MHITFYGAAQTVTGSCYLVEAHGCRFLIDCGMAQGGQEADTHNAEAFAFDASRVDFVILTHAHIDHSGLLPKLVAKGFKGPIYTTLATQDLLDVLLKDSAHIQLTDAERAARRKREGKKSDRDVPQPLYTLSHVARTMELVHAKTYGKTFDAHPSVRVCFRDAGHILGSAIVEIWLNDGEGGTRKLVASGDLGQPGRVILRDPTTIEDADVLLLESTYGDRLHKDSASTLDELVEIVNTTAPRGNVVIPAFAVGRTQELLYHFLQLKQEGRLAHVEIFVDSPMAVAATAITMKHFSVFDEEAHRLLGAVKQLQDAQHVHFITDVEDSIKLNRIKSGAVIISASGMCDAGRVLHHLRNNLGRSECAVVICGFQSKGSLGRRLVDGVKQVRMFGEQIDVRASVHTLGGFSAHADQKALLEWAGAFRQPPRHTYVVHGEEHAAQALAAKLQSQLGFEVRIPQLGQRFDL
ncbi:MBL fold metallo-hydrolase RNA specificity domain-containing protein [Comamonas sp. NoAH]|uniref:MBL fold metallo-hydrolase RNA specificity domain-containing protein n=1 Tax=Comamonas halotolerans TaxID=3041496 RepID=UPI0024E101E4|nr:MBL fold metallo-hydrolase [Comamonas sp. NoAH]